MILLDENPTSLGFAMEGMGVSVLNYVNEVCERFKDVTYVEIGVAHGITLTAVAYRLRAKAHQWRAIGIELPNGYSFNRNATRDNAMKGSLKCEFIEGIQKPFTPPWDRISVCLRDSQSFLGEYFLPHGPVHMAIIDGCHGKPCATMDFLLLEPMMAEGGIVMFHDIDESLVGCEQPHCGTLDVIGAIRDLGLLDDKRTGWMALPDIIGDKQHGSANMGVYQKI